MKNTLLILLLLTVTVLSANAQSTAPVCPPERVCISVEQARQALIDADTVRAQTAEIAAKETVIEELRAEIGRLRIELAKMTGEKTGADQANVRLTAIVDLLLKSAKKKCMPFSVCF